MVVRKKMVLLFGVCAFLIFLLVNSVFQAPPTFENLEVPDIAAMLSGEILGWNVRDLPVGETEEVKQKMGEILDYDAAVFREYQKGLVKVQVYVSYWRAGKAHFRSVYGHTPDVCWVRGGWSMTDRNPEFNFSVSSDPPITLKTGQYREFTIGSEVLRVIFWQLLDGEPFTYGNYSTPPITAIMTDLLNRGFDQKPEQWFVRVSANTDFDRLARDPGFQSLISSISRFGLEKAD